MKKLICVMFTTILFLNLFGTYAYSYEISTYTETATDANAYCGCCHSHNHDLSHMESRLMCTLCKLFHKILAYVNLESPDAENHISLSVLEEESPNCQKDGYQRMLCAVCNKEYTVVLPKREHELVFIESIEATCCSVGATEKIYCKICGEIVKQSEEIPMLLHTVVTDSGTKPTCTQSGLTEGTHCSVCGLVLSVQKEIPPLEHSFTGWTVVLESTCENEGEETRRCERCSIVETREIPKKHTYVIDEAIEPTCTQSGLTEGTHCSVCGLVLVTQQEVAPLIYNMAFGDFASFSFDINIPHPSSTNGLLDYGFEYHPQADNAKALEWIYDKNTDCIKSVTSEEPYNYFVLISNVNGSGELSFDYSFTNGKNSLDAFILLIDSKPVCIQNENTNNFEKFKIALNNGKHTIIFMCTGDDENSECQIKNIYYEEKEITQKYTDLICTDSDDIEIASGFDGERAWEYDAKLSEESASSVYIAGNRGIDNSVSNIAFTVKGSGTITFDIYVSTEGFYDIAYYSIGSICSAENSGMQMISSGKQGWKSMKLSIDAANDEETTVYIAYIKDESNADNEDKVGIKNVCFVSK